MIGLHSLSHHDRLSSFRHQIHCLLFNCRHFYPLRHPWTFIVQKGIPSAAVEDHAVYQGIKVVWISWSELNVRTMLMPGCCVNRVQSLLGGPELL